MLRSVLLAVLLASCSHDMSDREYCVRRQMGWEMAFPNLPQTDADRSQFVESCVANVAKAHDNGELDRSIRCMDEHLKGHGHAYEQYIAFTRCELVDPSRAR
ncbi:MAG TPA: hypothetical protein VHN14_01680 [Kofleriaceae bacterium]|jgi:hypothetical protein|nr:hypothetical protein [Kofleriaceae bacterium]